MEFKFDKELYSKLAFIKAAYNFTDNAYLHLSQDEGNWIVHIKPKEESVPIDYIEFENEMLAQSVRCLISDKTSEIRKLIMARAFASTMIGTEPDQDTLNKDMDISNALKDWFETNE